MDSGLNAEARLSRIGVGSRVGFGVAVTGRTYAPTYTRTHAHTITCTQATSLVGESETWTHVLTQVLDLPLHEVISNSRRINSVCNIMLIVCLSRETSAIHNRNKERNKERNKQGKKEVSQAGRHADRQAGRQAGRR